MSALQKEIEDILRRVLEDTRPHQTLVMPDARSWDVKQCAEYLGISEGLLRAKVASEEIPHFRVGNRVLFHPHEIRNWRGTTEVSTRASRAKVKVGKEISERKPRGAR